MAIRKDIASLGGNWAPEILWYARAVGALRKLPFNNRNSWTYLAAIHGFDPDGWQRQGIVTDPSIVPAAEQRLMLNQCQHAGWFFLPWHRGYLWAFEAILAHWIAENGGPKDWALPYWNYLDATNPTARNLPPEFLDPQMPDGTPNPLRAARRGPATKLGPEPWIPSDINLDAQTNQIVYTAEPGTLGYGGPISGFAQQGNAFGGVESNPHNYVHLMIGGDNTPNPLGWMYDPNYAGLDPIFWFHHCNIDRLWAAWMTDASHQQEKSTPWRNGPFPRQFTMPRVGGALAVFIPADTLPGAVLEPKYDDLSKGTGIPAGGAAPMVRTTRVAVESAASADGAPALIAASDAPLTVGGGSATSSLTVERASRGLRSFALTEAAVPDRPAFRVYLNAEGVRGTSASAVLTLSVAKAGGDGPAFEKTLVFFGLANATEASGPHGGAGLTGTVEVTDEVHELGILAAADIATLEVTVEQPGEANTPLTVDRISLYASPA